MSRGRGRKPGGKIVNRRRPAGRAPVPALKRAAPARSYFATLLCGAAYCESISLLLLCFK